MKEKMLKKLKELNSYLSKGNLSQLGKAKIIAQIQVIKEILGEERK